MTSSADWDCTSEKILLLQLPGNKKHSIENIFDIQCPFMENWIAIML